MSQKSSVPQAISFVSQVLKRDILFPNLSQCRQDDTGPRIAPPGFELVTVGEALLLLSQPFDSTRLMLLRCLLKRRLDLGFHFSAFLRKRPTPTASYLCCPRWTIGGPANIAKHRPRAGAQKNNPKQYSVLGVSIVDAST